MTGSDKKCKKRISILEKALRAAEELELKSSKSSESEGPEEDQSDDGK